MKKKFLAGLLAIVMMITVIPLDSVYAANAQTKETKNDDVSSAYSGTHKNRKSKEGNVHSKTQNALYPNKKCLLIEDNLPWDSTANHEVIGSIMSLEVISAANVIGTDISGYDLIVYANDQGFDSYSKYAIFREKLESFVKAGGVLIFGACDSGWENGNLVEDLPGGVTKSNEYESYNYIVDSQHPIVTGILSGGSSLTNDELYSNYCSHVSFDSNSLPEGTNVILKDSEDRASLIEYPMGKGYVIASGLTWEHNYVYGGTDGRGEFSEIAFDDLFLYGLALRTGEQLITPFISYSIKADNIGLFVGDKTEKSGLSSAKVTINGASVEVDSYGVAQTNMSDGTYEVKVSCDGYYSRTKVIDFKKGTMKNIYLTKKGDAEKPYIEEAIIKSDDEVDVLQNTLYFIEGDETEVTYNFGIELAGKTLKKFLLYQGEKIVELTSLTGKLKPGTQFSAESPIYLQLVCEDGTKSDRYKTGIFIKEKSSGFILHDEKASEEYHFGNGIGFTVPGDIPIIGGTKFQYGIDSLPVSLKIDDNKVRISVGVTDLKSGDEAWEEYIKSVDEACKTGERIDKLKDLCKTYGAKSGGFTVKKGWKAPEFKVAGYIEGTWDGEKITSVSGKIAGGVEWEYVYSQQFVVGPAPVYFEIGGGFELELSAHVKKVLLETGQIQIDVPITFTPKFTIGGGVGVNGALSAGAEGQITVPVNWDIANQYIKVSGTGSMKLKASLLFVFKAEKEIAKGTWVIYESSYAKAKSVGTEYVNNELFEFDMSDYENYELLDTSYRNKTSGWAVPSKNRTADNLTSEQILQSYTLPNTRPQMVTDGDTTLMIFQEDNGSENVADCTRLMYSVLTESGWSEPKAVWENQGEADYYAQLKVIDDEIYVVWQKNAETTSQISDEMTEEEKIVALAKNMEIAIAKYDVANDVFTEQVYVTDNEAYDGSATFAKKSDGSVSVIWVENESGNILSAGTANKVMHAVVNGSSVSETEVLFETSDYIFTMEAEYVNDVLKVAYSADADGDLSTENDVECHLYNGSSVTALTDDEIANVNPQIVDGVLYWHEDGAIISYNLTSGVQTTVGNGTANFNVVKTTEGINVVYVNAVDENKEYFYSYKPQEDVSQNIVSYVTNIEGILDSYDVIVDEDGTYRYVYGFTKADDASNFQIGYQEVSGTNDLYVSDLSALDKDCADGTQKVSVTVGNEGLTAAEGFAVNIYEGEELIDSIEYEDVIGVGETKELDFTFERSVVDEIVEYKFEVSNNNDGNADNNIQTVELGYNDICMNVSEYHINNNVEVFAEVSNLTERTSDVEFKVYEDSLDGEVVYSKKLSDVSKDDVQIVSFELNRSEMDITPGKDKLYVIEVTAEDEQASGDNQYLLLLPTLENEIIKAEIEEDENNFVYDLDEYKGKTVPLAVKTVPETVDKTFTWDSSDTEVASVDENGVMTVKSAGTTKITVTVNEFVRDTINVYVVDINKDAPSGLKIVQNNTDAATFSWTGTEGISNYEIYRATEKDGEYSLLGRTASTSYSDEEVSLGETYYYKVRGYVNRNGHFLYTEYSNVLEIKIVLDAPTVSVSQYEANNTYISWGSVGSSVTYEIYRATSKNGTYKKIYTTSSRYYYDYNLVPNKTYYYKVRAISGDTKSKYSNIANIKIALPKTSMSVNKVDYRTLSAYVYTEYGAVGYQIYRSTSEKGTYTKIADSSQYGTYDTGLTTGKTYYYKARYYVEVNNKKYYSPYTSVVNYKLTLDAPTWSETAAAGANRVYLEWYKVDGADGYIVYESDSYSGTYKKLITTTLTSYTRKGLKANSSHYYKVVAYKGSGKSRIYSDESYYRYVTAGYNTPYDINVVHDGKNNKLTYKKPYGATGVEISAYSSEIGDYKVLKTTKENSYTHKNVTLTYTYYRIRCYRMVNGKKEYGNYVSVTGYTYPPEPENFKVSRRNGTSLKLTWKSIPWAKGYMIYRKDGYSGGTYYITSVEGGAKNSYIDKGLIPGQTYGYYIRAYSDSYNGDSTEYYYQKPIVLTTKLNASSVYNAAVLKWKKAGDVTGYEIYKSTSKNGTYSLLKRTTKASTITYKDTKVTQGKTYYYKIRSYKTIDGKKYYSSYTNSSIKITVAKPVLTAKSNAKKKVKLTWKKVAGASGYQIQRSVYKAKNFTNQKTISSGSKLSYTNTTPKSKKTYYYRIRAYRKVNGKKVYGPWSAVKSCKTK